MAGPEPSVGRSASLQQRDGTMTQMAAPATGPTRGPRVAARRRPSPRGSSRLTRGTRFAAAMLMGSATVPGSGHAGDAAIAPNADGLVTFVMPSMNIECTYVPAGGTPIYRPPLDEAELSCDRAEPSYIRLSIGVHGPAVLLRDPGDRPCCGVKPRLDYGRSVRLEPFTCRSEETGLTCRRDDGAGFFVSREKADTVPQGRAAAGSGDATGASDKSQEE